ncbi:hypothetical protein E1B28_009062 [Marasmius oreades]|uniref:Protein kinase domain-containing protein n=1 Tax=Marasmius oreades TaxID=181124 RepID=A0A9P7UUX2_9AGAR|nr:uncharacterized protein E1B28_009062 [Marasmius oreades]KAG7092734.1 hypothetical protein E1B28_009062 [Marasmius oreades]
MSSPPRSPTSRSRRYPLRRSPPGHHQGTRVLSSALKRVSIPHRKPATPLYVASSHTEDVFRPVLVPLQANLRRLTSRVHLVDKFEPEMHTRIGGKRKRVASTSNENSQTNGSGRQARTGRAPLKRFRSSSYTSEEDYTSSMDIDSDRPLRWGRSLRPRHHSSSMEIDLEDEDEDEDDDEGESCQSESVNEEDGSDDVAQGDEDESDEDNTDEHLLSSAPLRTLTRLRKEELIRLYNLAGLSGNDDPESLTKSRLAEDIIAARDDFASLPPSSPLGRGAGLSDYSSEGECEVEEPEEEVLGAKFLRRRATTNDISHGPGHVKRSSGNPKPLKNRSFSMGHIDNNGPAYGHQRSTSSGTHSRQRSANGECSSINVTRSNRTSSRSSPTNSSSHNASSSTHQTSPPAHHLRSRKISAPTLTLSHQHLKHDLNCKRSKSKESGGGKGRRKQVEFTDVPSNDIKEGEESDLTELEELEAQLKAQPSPRRLRSRDKLSSKDSGSKERIDSKGKEKANSSSSQSSLPPVETLENRRITPMRKAKRQIRSLKEDSEGDVEEEVEEVEDEGEEIAEEEVEEGDEEGDEEGGEEGGEIVEEEFEDEDEGRDEEGEEIAEEEEVDELVSTGTATPPPHARRVNDLTRRTPLRKRLRPRNKIDPSDGDDEQEDMEVGEEDEEETDVEEASEEQDDADAESTASTLVTPKKLRSGKIIGEEEDGDDVEMDVDDEDEAEAEEEAEEDGADGEEEEGDSEDAEGETDEEVVMDQEEDVDLTVATAKTLVRLRRADLVRLCESRSLEPVGTKAQIAEALLQWRDRQQSDFSSPSSTGTVRPPSTVRRRRHRKNASTPVLLRSPNDRVHLDEPRTPPVTEQDKDLELDLGELGLEDREIPPEKLQKLEKIGSGGFKDVFIGKFKGRKVAISEFRGQLSAMDIKELKLLGGFDHPNIVRFLGVSIPENTRETPVMIVSELCTNGDLFDYIRNVNPPTLHKVLSIMLDIARGLEHLHMRKPSVIHRDCKSSNILITSKGTAKIADFGLAKVKQSTRSMVRSLVGTVNWQAPELWHAHPKYNHKVDVFSCACVYWEILQWHMKEKKFPWEGMNEHAIYEIVGSKRQRPSLTGSKKQWCPEIVDLIERMWAHEHQDRPTMSEVVEALEDMLKFY